MRNLSEYFVSLCYQNVASTQVRKYASTQVRKYASTQVRKYAFFFFLLLGFDVLGQNISFCNTKGGNPILFSATEMASLNSDNPFYLKVYFHVVKRANGTGGQTNGEVDGILNLLNEDFNPHNIFFIEDCGERQVIQSNAIYQNGKLCDFTSFTHADGIDVFLMGDDAISLGGEANNIPGDYFFVSGSYWKSPFGSIPKSRIISHEMGHCLGLWHTHHGEELPLASLNCDGVPYIPSNICLELVNGSNGTTCGDYIQDTPADPNIAFNVNANCQWQGSKVDPNGAAYNPDEKNIMSYTSPDCMAYFTEGQGAWMRAAIQTSPVLQACLTGQSSAPTYITTNTIFSGGRDLPGDLIVQSGAQLEIKSTIRMKEGHRIIVERNARLKISSGGEVVKNCKSPYWSGIQVFGNRNKTQPDKNTSLNDPDQSGIVIVEKGGAVKNALTGISTGGGYAPEYWGGLIFTDNANFEDNRRDIEIMSYKFSLNKSRFNNTRFRLGNGVQPGASSGVTIWETDGIEFNRCTFSSKTGDAVLTFDASIKVKQGSAFESNDKGICTYATYPMSYTSQIGEIGERNNFYGNNIAIDGSLASGFMFPSYNDGQFSYEIINNFFEFNWSAGVVLDGSSNYRILGNEFRYLNPIPVHSTNSGYNNAFSENYIVCNDISYADYGIAALGDNHGLQFLKNNFSGTTNADFVLAASGLFNPGVISDMQGKPKSPAGNCFSIPPQTIDISTYGNFGSQTVSFDYYHDADNFLVQPVCYAEPRNPGNYSKFQTTKFQDPFDCSKFGGLASELEHPSEQDLMERRLILHELQPLIETDVVLKDSFYRVQSEKEAILKYLLSNALAKETFHHAEFLLNGENTKAAKQAIYGLRVKRGDYEAAATLLSQLPLEDEFDMQFRDIQMINLQRLQNSNNFVLTLEQEAFLNTIADGTSPIRGYARGILALLKGNRYYPDPIDITLERGAESERKSTLNLSIYPNPAFDQLSVTLPHLDTEAEIKITDCFGQTKQLLRVTPNDITQIIPVKRLSSGIYFLSILEDNGRTHQTKFVVQH
jgi:Secretion system C-terminal sorting domain